ncbi:MAG: hypothetical protein IT374_19910 [Polyangiaceae bacterium]|nr:hypothetical protein [Polyangiaceae bacterium]
MSKRKPGKSKEGRKSRRSLAPDARPSSPPASDARPSSPPESGEHASSPSAAGERVSAPPLSDARPSSPPAPDAERVPASPPPPDSLAPLSRPEESPEPAAAATTIPVASDAGDTDAKSPPAERPSSGRMRAAGDERPSARRLSVSDDDHHDAFFSGADAAVEKMHADARAVREIEDQAHQRDRVVLTPAQRERQRRLRRWVAFVVAGAAAASALALVRMRDKPHHADPIPAAAPPPRASAVTGPTSAPRSDDVRHAASASPSPDASASPPAAGASPESSASAAASASAPAPSASAAADPAAAKELTKKALRALERGDYKATIDLASRSIDADPSDANAYLYWGTALMETGKRADAKVVFGKCVELATRGPKHDCRAFR